MDLYPEGPSPNLHPLRSSGTMDAPAKCEHVWAKQ